MSRSTDTLKWTLEHIVPWIILGILLTYSYADFFEHPFGFWWGTPDGTITKIFVIEREPTLHAGDKLLSVGSVTLQSFNSNLRKNLFEGIQPGQIVPITVQRGDQVLTVDWRLPGPNPGEQRDQFFSPWWLAYIFWGAGTLTLLILRPKGPRWFLMAAFDFVTAIWLSASSGLSFFHIWYSALVFRAALWISVPIYLHLHWIFPRSLGRLPSPVVWGGYLLGGLMAVLQWFQLIPQSLSFRAFLVAIIGSLILLVVHAVRQPDMRRDLRLLLIAAFLAIMPSIVIGLVSSFQGAMPSVTGLSLFSLPMLPIAYLYAANRRQLGGLELRMNRLIALYAFVILLGVVMVPLLVLLDYLPLFLEEQTLIVGVIVSILATAASLAGYPIFQRYVERRFLGIAVPSRELQQTYTSHITRSTTFPALTQLLCDEILPSLLVRQFAFVVLDNGSSRALLKIGISDNQKIPLAAPRLILTPLAGRQLPNGLPNEPAFSWVRLILPLQVEDNILGFWLFGRRDPDDLYSVVEIPILQSFASQAAIAVSNILQTERLRSMYQADINRHENERLSLARDLHDSVLSELAGMLMNADMGTLPVHFQEGYKALAQRLRQIVSELRPPMLNYGLKPAIDELADKLMERTNDAVDVVVELDSTGDRYPSDKEQHLFRIVQEACENAVRHSHCKKLTIFGVLAANGAELTIEDDGDGFLLLKKNIELYDLISQRHFGLAGMFERAKLIDAEIRLTSKPGAGTRVFISWHRD